MYNYTLKFCKDNFSSEFDILGLYSIYIIHIISVFGQYALEAKKSIKKIKTGMNDPRVIEIIAKAKKKPNNFNDKILLFFTKNKMATLFFIFIRFREKIKKLSPKIFGSLKKTFAKRHVVEE